MNDEQLISLVESRSSIFDKTDKFYTNKTHVRCLWKEIAHEMQVPVAACQKRWRYLRDYFVRQLHMTQNGRESSSSSSTKKKSLWALFDRLEFLAPFSSTRRTRPKTEKIMYYIETSHLEYDQPEEQPESVQSISSGGNSVQDLNDLDYANIIQYQQACGSNMEPIENESILEEVNVDVILDDMEMEEEQDDQQQQQPGLSSCSPIPSSSPLTMPQKGHKRKRSEMYDELIAVLKMKRQETEYDEHDHFFKSLLGSVRKIDEEHIMSFRTEILQVIMKYMYMSQGENLMQLNGQNNNSDVVVIDTGELHWRKNLGLNIAPNSCSNARKGRFF